MIVCGREMESLREVIRRVKLCSTMNTFAATRNYKINLKLAVRITPDTAVLCNWSIIQDVPRYWRVLSNFACGYTLLACRYC